METVLVRISKRVLEKVKKEHVKDETVAQTLDRMLGSLLMDQRIRRCELCKRQAERLHIAFEPEQEYCGEIYGPAIYIACFDCLHAIDKITTLDPAIPHVRLIV